MARFWVEFISAGMVEAASTMDAPTPVQAAQKAANATVIMRTGQDAWIKVTPVRSSTAYEFAREHPLRPF